MIARSRTLGTVEKPMTRDGWTLSVVSNNDVIYPPSRRRVSSCSRLYLSRDRSLVTACAD